MDSIRFSSIVCAVDFSDHSIRALRYAIALASRSGGRVTVAHVAHPLLMQAAVAAYDVAAMNRDTDAQLRAIADGLMTDAAGWAPEIGTSISVGDPAIEIVKTARAEAADLIVMGTHGRSGYRKMFFGSVTERVLRLSPTPVFAVPPSDRERIELTHEGPRFSLGSIMAPTDLGAASVANAHVAQCFSAAFDVPLLLVHVIPPIPMVGTRQHSISAHRRTVLDRARERLRMLASELPRWRGVETHLRIGAPAAAIAALGAERNVGLIVMGLHSDDKSFGLRLGSVAYGVLCLVQVPVLALPGRIPEHLRGDVRRAEESTISPADDAAALTCSI